MDVCLQSCLVDQVAQPALRLVLKETATLGGTLAAPASLHPYSGGARAQNPLPPQAGWKWTYLGGA